MKKVETRQAIIVVLALVIIVTLIMQLVLYAMGKVSGLMFWMHAIFAAAVAYWGIPYLKKLK